MKDHWVKYLLALLTASTFGPYLAGGGGVRLEHLVLYGAGALAGGVFLFRMHRIEFNRDLFTFSVLLVLPLVWIVVVSLGLGGSAVGTASIPVFENFFQSWAVVFLLMVLANYNRLGHHLETVVKVFMICLGINATLALCQIFIDENLFGLLNYFRTPPNVEGETVASRAISMGRFIGVYNQPLEAGSTYSLGVLGWAWLENNGRNFRTIWRYGLLGLMVVGGLLSISKVFILGGTVLFLVYMFLFAEKKVRRRFLYALPVFGGLIGWYVTSIQWSGLRFLRSLLFGGGGNESLLVRFTAGRFGGDRDWGEGPGIVALVTEEVMRESPFVGFGMEKPPILDNGLVAYLYHGGVVAAAMYCLLLFWLLFKGYRLYRVNGRRYVYLLFIGVLAVGITVGAPAFTLNRFSMNAVLMISLLLLMRTEPAHETGH